MGTSAGGGGPTSSDAEEEMYCLDLEGEGVGLLTTTSTDRRDE